MIGRHLFDLVIEGSSPIYCPDVGAGAIYIGSVTGGRFEGERIAGEVLPAGGDWARVAPCGAARLDVKLMLRTDRGELFSMMYSGRMHGPGETLQRLGSGGKVDPSEYYMRIAPVFEAHAADLSWLDCILAVGTGEVIGPGKLRYKVMEVD